jgi:beta-glucanase (GH16 family)
MGPGLVRIASRRTDVSLRPVLLLVILEIAACGNANAPGTKNGAIDSGPEAMDQAAPVEASVAETQPEMPEGAIDATPPDASAIDAVQPDASVPETSHDAGAVDVTAPAPDARTSDSSVSDASTNGDAATVADAARAGWRLTWSDEFNGPKGAPPDATKWTAVVGVNNSNGELEYYTNRPSNLALDGNGNLLITSLRESYMGSSYTSARINTAGKFSQAYGRFESRVKLPMGHGMWPAFWVLGANEGQVGWPACGEIDIMENAAKNPNNNNGALHGPGYSGANGLATQYILPGGYSSDFHVFAAEWEPNVVRLYVDDHLYVTRTPADLVARGGNLRWVFDHAFYIILNLAIGGGYPGNPDSTTPFPQALTVDYVRVYSR